ncbi:MAG: serine hydroxymethyltransferase [Bdellovibrionales bacterium]|nr:serine hydroxymethyltransferase [Bdellovibrionales bacterium]
MSLEQKDSIIFSALQEEMQRQKLGLEMIASENYVSSEVLEAQGSIFTNKYAEGYPGKRYYGGCTNVDTIENVGRDRLKELFSCDHANIQPHSGSSANMAVYFAVLKPQDTILGMDLSQGGHLTHGSPVNFSGFIFQSKFYGVDEKTNLIDYNKLEDLAKQYKPKLLIAGHSAYPRFLDFEKFKTIADQVGCPLMVDMAHFSGLVAGVVHPSPIPYADLVTSTTHKTLRGPRGGFILCKKEWAKKVDSKVFPGMQGGPLPHVMMAKAVAFKEALEPSYKIYAQQIVKNAKYLSEQLIQRGFNLVTGGTDNHLILINLNNKNLNGKEAEDILHQAGITVNKNTVPGETRSPFVTSGIRIGTPALTTRGMKEKEMGRIAEWMSQVIENRNNEKKILNIKGEVKKLCSQFPLFHVEK